MLSRETLLHAKSAIMILTGDSDFMDLLGMVMGWNWKVQRTRRRWDRLREHTLEKKGVVREKALKDLDEIEDKLRMLEEEDLSRRDRTKILREINMGMANVQDLLEQGEVWLASSHGEENVKKRHYD